jgi:hypothetical protein
MRRPLDRPESRPGRLGGPGPGGGEPGRMPGQLRVRSASHFPLGLPAHPRFCLVMDLPCVKPMTEAFKSTRDDELGTLRRPPRFTQVASP